MFKTVELDVDTSAEWDESSLGRWTETEPGCTTAEQRHSVKRVLLLFDGKAGPLGMKGIYQPRAPPNPCRSPEVRWEVDCRRHTQSRSPLGIEELCRALRWFQRLPFIRNTSVGTP